MSDERFDGKVSSLRDSLEQLSHIAGDLSPSHQQVVENVLEACSASAHQLQTFAEEREHLLTRIRESQKQLEELATNLEREREIQQTMIQHTAAHLALLDPEFNFVRVNDTYSRGSGHTAEELIGRNHFDLFPHAENQALFERVRDTGEPIRIRAKPFELPDQPERGVTYWDWTLEPVADGEGVVQGLVLSLMDVTERKQTEEALQELAHNLGERVKELNCLHNISNLVETPGLSLEEIFARTAELIPPAMQYPETACARIV
ncbi:MAG: PAS domain-containing protein, partial [Anaerolineae bacterium]